jgi:leader peptidase (prepilin peptidase)/N-methyltransferase
VRISPRYPLIEALTALLFAFVSWRFGFVWELPAYLVLATGLIVLGAIDLEHQTLPRSVTFFTGIVVTSLLLLASAEYGEWHRALVAFVCAAGWFVAFGLLNLLAPHWLGSGDVRLAPVLGFALGWLGSAYVLVGFFVGDAIGAIVGIVLIALKRATGGTAVPFGPFLALGCAVAVLFGHTLLIPFHAG